ncbi:MAG: PKD domain-containing protein [Anaerolineae bacterium]|nr:PKD domain-containing protein [Anaerolineae bacterium]
MEDKKVKPTKPNRQQRDLFRGDSLLFVFLFGGWLLIFLFATLGLQRDSQVWLPINPVVRAAADYSVDENALQLAQVKPEIIDAVKQDAENREALKTPVPLTLLGSPTPTPTPSASATATVRSPLTVDVGGPYEGDEGSEISFVADNFNSVLDIIPGGVSYEWDLDGDGVYDDAEGPSASFVFYDEGDYPISVRASDLLGRTAFDTTVANVLNVDPLVQIGNNMYTSESRTVYFSASASDPGRDVLFFEWDFGDGSIPVNNTLRPEHIFWDDGEYRVTLRVRDNDGGLSEDRLTVYVGNLPPEINPLTDQTVDEGSPLTLKGQASDPAKDNDTLSYAWDFNYNGKSFSPDADGETVTTTYPDGPADVIAALQVKDEDGGESIETLDVTVNNVPPAITRISNSGPVGEGSFLDIVVSASDVGNDTLSYGFDWNNDGSYDTVQQSGSASHVWTNQGRHTVRIRVDDGDGGQVFSSTVVSTFNLTPTAIAQVPNSVYFEGSPVTFDASESSDPGDDVLTYAWDFGDQTTGTGVNPTHTYADNKPDHSAHSVTLTVTDDSGATDQDIVPVLILNANPTVNAGPDREIDEGDDVSVTFTGSNATDPGTDSLTFDWDFDFDGTFVSEATGLSTNFVYPLLDGPRDIIVALRVRDDDYPAPIDNGGQIGEHIDTFMLTVKNLPPTNVDAGGDYKGIVSKPITLTAAVANDISADPLTYAWDFDYDGSGSFTTDVRGRVVTHTWTTFGLKTVGLRVSDGDGGQVFDTAKVNVNAVPIANAGGPYSGLEGSRILFDGRGSSDPDNDPLRYSWSFGDGSPNRTGITTTHVYSDNRTYTATLTVRDSDDDSATDVVTATIYNANPVIPAIANQTATEGVPFNFQSLTNPVYDPGALDTLSFAWDFDYNGTFNSDATGRNVSRTFPDGPATFTIALRVRDDDYSSTPAPGNEPGESIGTFQLTVQNAPPIANAGGPNYNGVEGQPITLFGSVTDTGSNDTHTFAWDLDNNGTYETPGQTINHTWPVGGVYPVTLRVTDKDGASGTATATVTVNYNPRADAGGPYTGREGIPVTLDGSGSFDPDDTSLTYSWDFGDGSPPSTGAVVTHVYLDNGDYVATLTVTDGSRGGIGTDQADVTIANVPPTAVVGGPYSGNEGQAITMDGRGSFDPSPDDDATLTYLWDFGDSSPSPASADRVAHTYADNGVYNVSLTVTDKDGGTSSVSTTATVNNVNPTASAGGPYRTTINLPVNLNGSGSDVAADTLTFAWDLNNDGTFETPGQNVVNTWATPGVKTVSLRVTDDDGGSATSTTTVDVGSPPIAVAGGPYTGSENVAITLNGSGSSDPDGDPITYRWTFGDGSPAANGAVVNHTYVDNGAYVATLTVTDNRGGVATSQANVTITNAAPTANISGPTNGDEGEDITFDGRGSSDPGPNDTLSYNWDFGDGGTASGPTASHQYRDNGRFDVTLTVTDKDGASDSTSISITINNVAPTANAGGPYGGDDEAPAGVTIVFDGSGSSDPGVDDTLTYQWTFGDGSPPDTGPVVSHTYLDSGSYTVRLTVSDDDGDTNTDTILVVINNLPPTADAGGPYDTTVDTPVELTGSGSDIPADLPLTYEWDLDNNGTFETAGQTVDFTESTTGTYTIVLRVSDDDGGSTTASTTVQVNSLLPLAWLTLPFILTRLRKRKR